MRECGELLTVKDELFRMCKILRLEWDGAGDLLTFDKGRLKKGPRLVRTVSVYAIALPRK